MAYAIAEPWVAVGGERMPGGVLCRPLLQLRRKSPWRSQDSVDTLFPGLVSGFELLRADATEVAMPTKASATALSQQLPLRLMLQIKLNDLSIF